MFAGVYFVLFFAAMSFNIFFIPTCAFLIFKGAIPQAMYRWNTRRQLLMALVGCFDGMNG